MDPATAIFAGASAVSAFSKGKAASASALSDAERLDAEAQLADTQALQRDTDLREELSRFLSSTNSARAANGLSGTSPNALNLIQEATTVSSSERLIQTANDRQRAENMRTTARSKRRSARMSLFTGAIGAAVPLIQTQI